MRRVVVTGMGAITPIGLNVDEFWNGVRNSQIGIGPITKFDTSEFKVKIAAEVKGFDAKDFIDPKVAKRMELFSQYAVVAAKEASKQSGLDMKKEDPYRVGVAVGSGVGSLQTIERNDKILGKLIGASSMEMQTLCSQEVQKPVLPRLESGDLLLLQH